MLEARLSAMDSAPTPDAVDPVGGLGTEGPRAQEDLLSLPTLTAVSPDPQKGRDPMIEQVCLTIGFVLGFYIRRLYGFARDIYWHLKVGTCFRYQATGYRETRGGTNSDFCRRCGQPAGYHGWGNP